MSDYSSINRALDDAKFNSTHLRVWFLSAMGVFLDGFDLFIIGVCLPLIVKDLSPSPAMQGLIGAAAVLGAIVGASIGGRFTDRFGRKSLYLIDLCFFILFSLLSSFSWNIASLIAFRFLLGIGIGVDYPICASYVSEFMPTRLRGRMLIAAFSFQALGMMAGAGIGIIILHIYPQDTAWRWMLGMGTIPALIVLLLRTTVPESPRWLMENGKLSKAGKVLAMIIPNKKTEINSLITEMLKHTSRVKDQTFGYLSLFSRKYIRRIILSVVPWFLMDIATYGIGIFTPTIIAILSFREETNFILKDIASTEGAAFIDMFLIIGFLLNIWLIEKWGPIKLQIIGFAGMAAGLTVLAFAAGSSGVGDSNLFLVFTGFILFNLLMNMGPNATTFILPAELFPTSIRASAHGLATASAKVGAALGIFLLPIFKDNFGITTTLIVVAFASLLGLLITFMFRVNTVGQSLEELNP